jgi:PAS domain S-box-containing protein
MAQRMHGTDWSATPLGPLSAWSAVLKAFVDMVLSSKQPMFLAWGADRTLIYNDAYVPLLGRKHPTALGRPFLEVWAEVRETLTPLFDQVFDGKAIEMNDIVLSLDRHKGPQEAHFAFSYTPVRGENGEVCGLFCPCTETTEQVRMQARRDSEDTELRHLLQQMPGFVGVLSGPTHVFQYVNDAYVDISGPRDFVGRDIRQVFPELESQGFYQLLDAVYQTGERFVSRAMPIRLTGEDADRYIDMIYEPIRNLQGQVSGIFVGGYDVTEAHRYAEALRISEARLIDLNAHLERQVIERSAVGGQFWQISPDLLGVLNGDGYFERTNPAWLRVLGWSEEEVLQQSIFELLHPDDREPTRGGFEYMKEGNPILRFDNRYLRKDGGYNWFAWSAAPLGDAYYCSGRDITAEKEHAAALAASAAERDRVWRYSRDLLIVINLDGVFRAVNPACTEILGYRPEELIGRNLLEFIWPEDLAFTRGGLRAASKQDIDDFENRYAHKDGTPRWISWHTSAEGDVVYGYGRDITQVKAAQAQLSLAQEQLRQSQKMEAVGQLTGGLAHDFNNLLAVICGQLELLQLRLAQGHLGGVERYIGSAQGAARRAAALTQRLLAFSRRQTLDPRPTDANRLISGMEELIRRTIGPNIVLEVVGAGGLWPIFIDHSQLENAMLNLCINARDAMPAGGRITIETANKWLDDRTARERELPPGQYISICVTDTGTGMTPEVKARAFDPFFTTKPLGEGTGLGLSMIYGFVRQSGGQVRIYTEVGDGTTMCLYLPRFIGSMADADTPEVALPADHGTGETVLVIDDQPEVRGLIVQVLEQNGYLTMEAGDGPSGLKILQSDARVDLLITDVGLPGGMNGRQVADAARVARADLRVLFVTGYAENAVVGNGRLDPGMEIITKPFNIDNLSNKVREMLDVQAAR